MLTAMALALVPGALLADGGATGASFLSLDAGADAIAMGSAVAAREGGVGAVFWNPGGLGWLRGTEFTVAHSEYVQSIRYENLGAAYGTDRLALGVSVRGFFIGGLEERMAPSEAPLSLFGATGLAPAISCARSFGRRFAVGTSLKFVHQQVGADRAFSLADDIGINVVSGIEGLRAGAALANWGSGVKFADRSYPLPTRLRAGLSYSMLERALQVAGDVVKPFHQPVFACIGAEAVIRERISLRARRRRGVRRVHRRPGRQGPGVRRRLRVRFPREPRRSASCLAVVHHGPGGYGPGPERADHRRGAATSGADHGRDVLPAGPGPPAGGQTGGGAGQLRPGARLGSDL
jgi:hypothetical protein